MSKIKFRSFPQNYRELYQNRRAGIKRGGLQIHKLHFIAICYVCVEWIDSDFSML